MTSETAPTPAFDQVARRVWKRVLLRRWLEQMRLLAPWAVLVVVLALVIRVSVSASGGVWLAFLGILGWILAAVIRCWLARPDFYQSMALWDKAAGRREAFANAWWFEQKTARTETENEHLDLERERLPGAMASLAQDLPLKGQRWHAGPLAALGVFLLFNAWVSPEVVFWKMDEQMVKTAEDEARRLAETQLEKKDLSSLTEDEKKAMEELEKKIQDTAKDLAESEGKDAKEVLRSLERRAREAEELAKRLGDDRDAWASEALVEELRKHADTADLGDAVADKKAGKAADEADALAQGLKSSELTEEARERMNETLQEVAGKAEDEDKKRMVGEHVLGASEALEKQQAMAAGEEFQKLAERMRDLERRQKTQEELQKLADQLRKSGSNIAGQNEAGEMQEMAGTGQQSGNGDQGQQGEAPQVGQAQSGMAQQQLMPPGMGQMNPQSGNGQQMQQAPVPGTGQSQNLPMMSQAPEGSGEGGEGKPMMMAPVPGSDPGKMPDAFMLGQGDPQDGDMAIMMATPAGRDPGFGKAELNAEATERIKNGSQSVVTAQSNSEGQSTVRAVEGGVRDEAAGRSATEVAVEFLSAQEEALDESALPPSRREQVRRYFTELRKRFEPSSK